MSQKNLILVFLILIIIFGLGGFVFYKQQKEKKEKQSINQIEMQKLGDGLSDEDMKRIDKLPESSFTEDEIILPNGQTFADYLKSKTPTITTQPKNQYLTPGDKATFSVVATGDNLSYQWKRNDADIQGANSNTYTTETLTKNDDYTRFKVLVSNTLGSVTSDTTWLSVTPKINPVGTIPEVTTVSKTIDEKGGTITLPNIGTATIPAGAFTGAQTVTLFVDKDPKILSYVNETEIYFRLETVTSYVVKLNVGNEKPRENISISLNIPEEMKNSQNKIIALEFMPPVYDDVIDELLPVGGTLDSNKNAVTFNTSVDYFTHYLAAPANTYHYVCMVGVLKKK